MKSIDNGKPKYNEDVLRTKYNEDVLGTKYNEDVLGNIRVVIGCNKNLEMWDKDGNSKVHVLNSFKKMSQMTFWVPVYEDIFFSFQPK